MVFELITYLTLYLILGLICAVSHYSTVFNRYLDFINRNSCPEVTFTDFRNIFKYKEREMAILLFWPIYLLVVLFRKIVKLCSGDDYHYLPIHSNIILFIDKFKSAEDLFMNGGCYWFAVILNNRYPEDSRIMYDEVQNHFSVEIITNTGVRLYDITGDITTSLSAYWESWEDYKIREPLNSSRVIRDCVNYGD